jgi:hypothetical protein
LQSARVGGWSRRAERKTEEEKQKEKEKGRVVRTYFEVAVDPRRRTHIVEEKKGVSIVA